MTRGVETRLEGSTLVVRIPTRFQRRGARKRIMAPDGSEIVLTTRPQPDGTLVKALARAWRWQRMLDEGVYATVSEIGEAENISKSYISRILRLALLAPDVVEAILVGKTDPGLMLERLERAVADELGGAARLLQDLARRRLIHLAECRDQDHKRPACQPVRHRKAPQGEIPCVLEIMARAAIARRVGMGRVPGENLQGCARSVHGWGVRVKSARAQRASRSRDR